MRPGRELEVADALAEEAGRLAQDLRAGAPRHFVETKGEMDFVTHAGTQVEAMIRRRIVGFHPDAAILVAGKSGAASVAFRIVSPVR